MTAGIVLRGLQAAGMTVVQALGLYKAARSGDLQGLQEELSTHPVDLPDLRGCTPLMHAARGGHLEAVKLLIFYGADPRVLNRYGETALHQAVEQGRANVVSYLLKEAPPLAPAPAPVASAVVEEDEEEEGEHDATRPAFEVEKSPMQAAGEGRAARGRVATNLLYLAAENNHNEVIKVLMSHGLGDWTDPPRPEGSPLHGAVRGGYISTLELLLKEGLLPDLPDAEGRTALHTAVHIKDLPAVRLLLDSGADLEACADNGRTPLHVAASSFDLGVMSLLLNEHHACVRARDVCLRTPLHHAVASYRLAALSLLLDAGADVDAVDEDADTALHLAVSSDWASGAEWLIERGARVDLPNKGGETPIDIAVSLGLAKLAQRMEEHRKPVNHTVMSSHPIQYTLTDAWSPAS
jgi:ankyrin repeat protein